MREGSGLVRFSREFPQRYFDVGIAEQHAVTLAAGMACEGAKPVVAIYSTFLQRAYDQLIHDVALQNLDVTFAIDRGGLVGPDGPTHAGSFDLSYLRCIPNMVVMAPADEDECRKMLTTGFLHDGPAAVRYPRGSGTGAAVQQELTTLPIGKAEVRRRGRGIAMLAFGAMVAPCARVADALDATLVNMRFVKPLDDGTSARSGAIARGVRHRRGQRDRRRRRQRRRGAVSPRTGVTQPVLQLGLADGFLDHGSREELLAQAGLDAASIERAIRARFEAFTPASSLRSVS